MAVFNTTEAKEYFKNALRTMYSKNEATPDEWYVFSDAGGNSTWSFGQAQWDVGGNEAARNFLEGLKQEDGVTKEFSDDDIKRLSKIPGYDMRPGDMMEVGDLYRFD